MNGSGEMRGSDLEVDDLQRTERALLGRECQVRLRHVSKAAQTLTMTNGGNVVLENPEQAFVDVLVNSLQVTPRHGDAQNLLVEGTREAAIDELVVVNGLGNDAAAEREVLQVVAVDVRLIVRLIGVRAEVRLLEEPVVGVHHLLRELVVEFAPQPAGVDALLAGEMNVELAKQLVLA